MGAENYRAGRLKGAQKNLKKTGNKWQARFVSSIAFP
jgi:hypothetical protein